MTHLCDLSFFLRSLFGLWAFLLCCTGIIGIVFSLSLKRYRYVLLSFAGFIPSYFLWQVIFNISGIVRKLPVETPSKAGSVLSGLPWLLWFSVLSVLSFAVVLSISLNVRCSRTHITPLAIKQCGDRMSCGICYWTDSGRVIFSNDCMNRLCLTLTGRQLLNGKSFRDTVSDGAQAVGEETWNFTFRDLALDGRLLHEMVAWDVTEIYAKTEALQRGNEALSRMTEERKAYSLKIDDVVRRQEILQAKVNIHDEMNHLMLSTVAAEKDDIQTLDRVFTRWQTNALLLCREAEEKTGKNAGDKLENFAALLGISIQWNDSFPDILTEKQRDLFFTAAHEAIVNAVKHGEAKILEISFAESEKGISCIFENSGKIESGDICFTGGLANLSLLAGEQDAKLTAEAGEKFILTLCLPKKSR